jgi:hypothetical protein
MALFDRNDNRGYGNPNAHRGGFLDRVQNAFRGQDVHRGEYGEGGYGGGMNRGWNAGQGGYNNNRPMDRDGGLHQRNSWSDGAWTADAGERTDREWNLSNRGRMDYDRDMSDSPTQAGWRAGGMSGGMGMNRGGMDRDRGWNLGGGVGEWGHTGNLAGGMNRYDRGYSAGGGMSRGGGFLDRAQNAVRRGWDNIEDRFDRDDNDRNGMHLGGGAMRGGSSWAGNYDRDMHHPSDLRAYRDSENHYGVTHAGGMMGGNAGMGGMNRYGSDYDRGRMDMHRGGMDMHRGGMDMHRGGMDMDRGGMDMDRGDYDRGYKTRQQTDAGDPFGDRQNHTPIRMTNGGMGNRGNLGRYDENYRGGRDWF